MDSDNAKCHENTLNVEPLSKTEMPTLPRDTSVVANVNAAYLCKICHLSFSTKFCLQRHLACYKDPKYPCQKCGIKFSKRKQLHSHTASAHGHQNSNFLTECRFCKQLLRQPLHLQAHLAHYHKEQNESIGAEGSSGCPLKVKDVNTETSDWTNSHIDGDEDSKRETETQNQTIPETRSETGKRAESNAVLTKTVRNVVIPPTTDSQNRVDEEENKGGQRPRKDEETASKKAQNTDVLQHDLKSTYENEGTRTDVDSISVNDENSRELNDSENKSNQTIREIEQVFCLSVESTQVHDSQLENESDAVTNGNGSILHENEEKVSNFQSRRRNNENEGGEWSSVNQSAESEKHSQPQIVEIVPERDKRIDKDMKPTVLTPAVSSWEETPVTNKTTKIPEEEGVKIGTILRSSNDYDAIDNVHDIPEDKIVRTCADSQGKPQENNTDASLQLVCNYEEGRYLRKLHSCKDCYVPLKKLTLPERSGETVKTSLGLTQSQVGPKYTVIPSIVCDKIFATRDAMLLHYQQYHFTYTDTRENCVCGKTMNNYKASRFHFYRYCQKTVESSTLPMDSNAPCKPLEKTFACTVCGEKFWLMSCLGSHVDNCKHFVKQKVQNVLQKSDNISIAGREYKCQVCRTTFESKDKFLRHKKMYSRVAYYRCEFCQTIFSGVRQLNNHIKMAHSPNINPDYTFVCTICNQHFPQRRYERMHRLHFHRDEDFAENNYEPSTHNISPPDSDDADGDEKSVNKCKVCKIEFSSKKRFIDHTIYYMESEIIQCKTCGKKFEGQYRAHHHNKAVHYSEDTQMAFTHHCNVCKEGFIYMTHLQAHMFHVHISEAMVTTAASQDDRNESESQLSSNQSIEKLLYQLRDRDDGVIPSMEYACTVCDVKFPTPALLASHEVDFANDGEYLCNRCSTKCPTPTNLLDHLTLNHSNDAIQVGVKCRRCRENFLTCSSWVSHTKHFHKVEEPCEFYLEKNMSTEQCRDIRYELIPTNKSIASRATYFRVKSSIDSPSEKIGEDSFVPDVCGANIAIPKEELILDNSDEETEETSFNVDACTIEDEKPKLEVPFIGDFIEIEEHKSFIDAGTINAVEIEKNNSGVDTGIINAISTDEKKSAEAIEKRTVNTNRSFDTDETKKLSPMNKTESTVIIRKIREAFSPTGQKKWICDACGYHFSGPADLAKHVSLYSDSGSHLCKICGRSFPVHDFHWEHTRSHVNLEGNKYFCSSCSEAFKSFECIKMHVAHFHPETLNELPSVVSDINPAPEPGKPPKPRPKCRNNVRLGPWPENSSYHPIHPRCLEKSNLSARTYSYKQSNQLATVPAGGVDTDTKDVMVAELPYLHTEIFEDELSAVYECPHCHEKYSSVKRLDEHLMAVHNSNRDKNQLEKASKSPDDHATCHICDNVFTNQMLLNARKENVGSIKSIQELKTSSPELEITATIRSPKDPKDSQRPVDQLYKLDEVNPVPMPVISSKDSISKRITVTRIFGPPAAQQKQLEAKELNQLKAPQENSPKPKEQGISEAEQQNLTKTQQLNASEAEQQKSSTDKDGSTIVRIKCLRSASQNVLTHVNPSNFEPTSSSALALIEPMKIVKAESCSSTATTVGKKPVRMRRRRSTKGLSKCEYVCNICNVFFINKSHLNIHENNVHRPKKSKHKPTGNSVTDVTSSESSVDQHHPLASSLSTPADNQNSTEPQVPHTLDFERVLIPESADDFDFFPEKSPNNAELVSQTNPLNESAEERLSPDNRPVGSLKVRSFAKIVNILRKKSDLKRKNSEPIDRPPTKYPSGLFDPVAFTELCRQHNLLPEQQLPRSKSRRCKTAPDN